MSFKNKTKNISQNCVKMLEYARVPISLGMSNDGAFREIQPALSKRLSK